MHILYHILAGEGAGAAVTGLAPTQVTAARQERYLRNGERRGRDQLGTSLPPTQVTAARQERYLRDAGEAGSDGDGTEERLG